MINLSESFAAPAGVNDNAIIIPGNRDIVLVSNNPEQVRVITQANRYRRHFAINAGGRLTLGQGVTLSGGELYNTNDSGGINLRGGTLTMNEGSVIENCRRTTSGGGVVITERSWLQIHGGIIRNNSGYNGGGIHAHHVPADIYMTDGEIAGNTATGYAGGGVWMGGREPFFHMTGGSITGNTANVHSANVRIPYFDRFVQEPGAIVDW